MERLQLVYSYSRQLGDYSWSYYHNMTTTPKQDNTKKADDIIDVETTEVGPPTRLPPLKAPTIEPLGGWKQVRNYLINNLVHSHVYGFNYQEPSRTLGAYYAQFSELQLPPATDSDSDSEEETTEHDRNSQHVEPTPLRLRPKMSTRREPTTSVWGIPNFVHGRIPSVLHYG